MPDPDPPQQLSAGRRPTVFLSYASEDRLAAQALRDALPQYGLEVWYDEAVLSGGDAWDPKLRRQIRECDFFMALISAQTQARHEGYFRREWRLAAERSLDMSDDHLFLLPVVIDDTPQAGARVPEMFLDAPWTQVPAGTPNSALEVLCRRLLAAQTGGAHPPAQSTPRPARRPMSRSEQLGHAWEVLRGHARSAWQLYRALPGPWQALVAVVIFFVGVVPLMTLSDDEDADEDAQQRHSVDQVTRAEIGQQVSEVLEEAQGAEKSSAGGSTEIPLLAIRFSAPAGDAQAAQLAQTTFAQVYGRIALSHHGHARLSQAALPSADDASALERARQEHARYVLYGSVVGAGRTAHLTVRLLKVADGSQAWSQSYSAGPADRIDAAAIAADADAHLPAAQ